MYVYIYIYIEREREREYIYIYLYIYIYIYIYKERESAGSAGSARSEGSAGEDAAREASRHARRAGMTVAGSPSPLSPLPSRPLPLLPLSLLPLSLPTGQFPGLDQQTSLLHRRTGGPVGQQASRQGAGGLAPAADQGVQELLLRAGRRLRPSRWNRCFCHGPCHGHSHRTLASDNLMVTPGPHMTLTELCASYDTHSLGPPFPSLDWICHKKKLGSNLL